MGEDKNGKAIPYEQAAPSATYAPWLTDEDFIAAYESIKQYTLVDKYRCFELWQLVRETSKLRGDLLEVGVWRGGTGALIAKQAELSGIPSTVYLCDTFRGVVKAGENDSRYKGGEHSDTSEELVAALMGELNLKNTKILKGIFPDDTAPLLGGGPFRFCHIDVDVYLSAKEAAEWLWGKLVVGGMLVFDDYGFQSCGGVTKFVNEERNKKGRLVIHNLNGHGIIVKTAEA